MAVIGLFADAHFNRQIRYGNRHCPDALARLKADLAASGKSLNLVCIHHNLDARISEGQADPHCVRNAGAARQILVQSRRRIIVLQGHYHPGFYQLQQGIHYLTLRAMCEGPGLDNNAFAVLRTTEDRHVQVSGYGRQEGFCLG